MEQEVLKPTPGIQKHVDRLLKVFNGTEELNTHPSFHFVTSWCEVHWEESGLYTSELGDAFTAVHPEKEQDSFLDDELRDRLDMSDDAPVNDDMRLDYMRRHFSSIFSFDKIDADAHPTACTIRVRSTKGREAYLGYEIRGYSFSGVHVTWFGVFESCDALRANFRSRGFVTSAEECDALKDLFLLSLWQR